ncbi:MAG: hypothetical protein L0241_28105 [Planctomycetia bacterium]|nr:hypothetical protein [Planctomycetia bacterium]
MALVQPKSLSAAVLACAVGACVLAGETSKSRGDEVPPKLIVVSPLPRPAPAVPISAALELLQGSWQVVAVCHSDAVALTEPLDSWVLEIHGNALYLPFRDASGMVQQQAYAIQIGRDGKFNTIDLRSAANPIGLGIYEFPTVVRDFGQPRAYWRLALSVAKSRPKEFGGKRAVVFSLVRTFAEDDELGIVMMRITELEALIEKEKDPAERAKLKAELLAAQKKRDVLLAEKAVKDAEAEVKNAKESLKETRDKFDEAKKNVQAAELKLKESEKQLNEARKKLDILKQALTKYAVFLGPDPKKVMPVWIPATDKSTVSQGISSVVGIKGKVVKVWAEREGKTLDVNLDEFKKGDFKTDYQLQAGDRLYIKTKE